MKLEITNDSGRSVKSNEIGASRSDVTDGKRVFSGIGSKEGNDVAR